MHGRNRDSDIENRLPDTAGEGEGGTDGDSSMETYILHYVKHVTNGKLLYDAESPAWLSETI